MKKLTALITALTCGIVTAVATPYFLAGFVIIFLGGGFVCIRSVQPAFKCVNVMKLNRDGVPYVATNFCARLTRAQIQEKFDEADGTGMVAVGPNFRKKCDCERFRTGAPVTAGLNEPDLTYLVYTSADQTNWTCLGAAPVTDYEFQMEVPATNAMQFFRVEVVTNSAPVRGSLFPTFPKR